MDDYDKKIDELASQFPLKKTDEEMATEWRAMLGGDELDAGDDLLGKRETTRRLNRDEIDSLLGFDEDPKEEREKILGPVRQQYRNIEHALNDKAFQDAHKTIGRLLKIINELEQEIEEWKMPENRPCPYPEGPCAEKRGLYK